MLDPTDPRLPGIAGREPRPGSGAGSCRLGAVYLIAVALALSALILPKLPPCSDFPQHLAMTDIAGRLLDPSAPEHGSYVLEPVTFNGLFHLLGAPLSRVVGTALAGRLLAIVAAAGLALGVPLLLVQLDRPLALAGLFVPFVFGFSLRWGFVNFALGLALALVATLLVVRNLLRPSLLGWLGTALVAQLCAVSHVLAMLCLCLFASSFVPELAFRTASRGASKSRGRVVLERAAFALSPLLAGCAWCIYVYVRQYRGSHALHEASERGETGFDVVERIGGVAHAAVTEGASPSEQVLSVAVILVALGLAVFGIARHRWARRDETPGDVPVAAPLVGPLLVMGGAYLFGPKAFADAHLIYQRLLPLFVAGLLVAAPPLEGRILRLISIISLALGVLAGGLVAAATVSFARETDPLAELIDELPEGRNATAIIHGAPTQGFGHATLVHAAGHYASRRRGDLAFSFARYVALPLHFRAGTAPPWPQRGWEFGPADYDPRCQYARRFDLAIVRAPNPEMSEDMVRSLVFKVDANVPRLLGRRAAFWAFDTKGIAESETL
ncbi:MAG: hypothetical protein FJ096_15120 [Deltaproteobacteria bacterium]|nr:hypothetical protein [Deltaproteobacteria bacterium]